MVQNLYTPEILQVIPCLLAGRKKYAFFSKNPSKVSEQQCSSRTDTSLSSFELESLQWQCGKCGISSTFVCNSNKAHHRLYFAPHSTSELVNLQHNRKYDFCYPPPLVPQVRSIHGRSGWEKSIKPLHVDPTCLESHEKIKLCATKLKILFGVPVTINQWEEMWSWCETLFGKSRAVPILSKL